jgi:diguanylate cyclase (GGDEF)-like protein
MRATLARQATFRGEVLNYRKDGTPFWNALTISPLRDGEGVVTHFVSVQRDITAQKALQDRLRFLALHDVVTGLPNRAALEEYLSALARRQAGDAVYAAVGVIDLDDFKDVNDAFGHEAGDALLAEFGHRIRTRLPESAFLSRIGGDEFVVVIENLGPATAAQELDTIVGRLNEAVEMDFVLAPRASSRVRMSLGMALSAPTVETGDQVLRRADAALYHLKAHKGDRDKWWRLDNMAVTAQSQGTGPILSSEGQGDGPGKGASPLLLSAHRERLFSGGLLMYFQPVVDLDSGKVHLFEALSRLSLQDGTIQPPSAFVPYLSENDTNLLFRQGLQQSLAQLTAWESTGHRLRVSLNVHPATLLNPDCTQWVASALDRHRITPDRLVLELLEEPVEDRETKRRTVDELLALGVGLAQDDLGAGHSNLRRLTALAFDTVKLDHRLVAQLGTSPIPTLTFLSTMVTMGQDMGWNVVAEGLEDAGITEAATILGIRYGQGYHLAAPMPADDVPAWLSTFRAPARSGPVRTFTGALAFHWKSVRLDSFHHGRLEGCRLTEFLAQTDATGEAIGWHQDMHDPSAEHGKVSARLMQWLTDRVGAGLPVR